MLIAALWLELCFFPFPSAKVHLTIDWANVGNSSKLLSIANTSVTFFGSSSFSPLSPSSVGIVAENSSSSRASLLVNAFRIVMRRVIASIFNTVFPAITLFKLSYSFSVFKLSSRNLATFLLIEGFSKSITNSMFVILFAFVIIVNCALRHFAFVSFFPFWEK